MLGPLMLSEAQETMHRPEIGGQNRDRGQDPAHDQDQCLGPGLVRRQNLDPDLDLPRGHGRGPRILPKTPLDDLPRREKVYYKVIVYLKLVAIT